MNWVKIKTLYMSEQSKMEGIVKISHLVKAHQGSGLFLFKNGGFFSFLVEGF